MAASSSFADRRVKAVGGRERDTKFLEAAKVPSEERRRGASVIFFDTFLQRSRRDDLIALMKKGASINATVCTDACVLCV